MKKFYIAPVAEIEKFTFEDVVTLSPEPTTGSGGGNYNEETTVDGGEF
ncbi:MAG: hypothetical protein K6C14_00615 [Eubacterium sp.]|nr:hypothetical protein [Eubacterium sp.]